MQTIIVTTDQRRIACPPYMRPDQFWQYLLDQPARTAKDLPDYIEQRDRSGRVIRYSL